MPRQGVIHSFCRQDHTNLEGPRKLKLVLSWMSETVASPDLITSSKPHYILSVYGCRDDDLTSTLC